MHRIEIDDEVYVELEQHVKGFEQPNDVLRRLLLKDMSPTAKVDPTAGQKGRLFPLIEAGLIKTGDEFRHEKTRKGIVYDGTVTETGWITTGKGLYQAPSPALAALTGSQIDGWANWIHVPSGKSLRQLRSLLEKGHSAA